MRNNLYKCNKLLEQADDAENLTMAEAVQTGNGALLFERVWHVHAGHNCVERSSISHMNCVVVQAADLDAGQEDVRGVQL